MKIKHPFSAILASAVLASVSVGAADGHQHEATGDHGKASGNSKVQTHCPVKGGKAQRDCFADQDGLRVYLCSATCSEEFAKAPAEYIGKLRKQGVTVAKVQTTCPVTGKPIKKSAYVDIARLRIYLCSEGCADVLKKSPGRYVKQQMTEGVAFDSPTCDAQGPGGHEGHSH